MNSVYTFWYIIELTRANSMHWVQWMHRKLRTVIKIHIDCCSWTALRWKSNHWILSVFDLLFVFQLIHCKFYMDMDTHTQAHLKWYWIWMRINRVYVSLSITVQFSLLQFSLHSEQWTCNQIQSTRCNNILFFKIKYVVFSPTQFDWQS